MTGLRLLADDLTGALDAAAPFAAARGPIGITWLGEAAPGGPGPRGSAAWTGADAAISTASRDLPPEAALDRVRRLAPGLAGGRPAFKKIDSMLRGNTAEEIVAAHRAGAFGATVVCPAFPAQGRIVRGGRLLLRAASGAVVAGPDLAAMLRNAGADRAVVVSDADSEDDIDALVDAHRDDATVLWAGSSGLARGLAGRRAPLAMPAAARVLIVTGSRHPLARTQIAVLRRAFPDAAVGDDGGSDPALLGQRAVRRLSSGASVVLDAAPAMENDAAAAWMARCFEGLAAAAPPDLLAVIGGDTLARLLAALACHRLTVEGEVSTGVPLACIADGRWSGTRLISRSGGFDDGGTIMRLLATAVDGA
jgi:uncharacterized protein YgbK (DUF1537 family)